MRRDIGFFVNAPIDRVYQAYLNAASAAPFDRTCDAQPYHTISFGLNFSMKYNFNGGSCNIHLMPYETGTAVNMRFTLAQAAGARYGKYADNLNTYVQKYVNAPIQPATYRMDHFLLPENQVTPGTVPAPKPAPAAVSAAAPVTPAPAQSAGRFCGNCGKPLSPQDKFCANCGKPAGDQERTCPGCGKPVKEGARFCTQCGKPL